jgi:hypothetical protein
LYSLTPRRCLLTEEERDGTRQGPQSEDDRTIWDCSTKFCIEAIMRRVSSLAIWLLAASMFYGLAYAGTPGSFRGTVVEGDQGSPREGWLYIRSRNGSIRRVDISQATVGYDETVPADQRKSSARQQLVTGAEVRVTAEQGSDGEWRASRVEIVKPAPVRSAAGTTG